MLCFKKKAFGIPTPGMLKACVLSQLLCDLTECRELNLVEELSSHLMVLGRFFQLEKKQALPPFQPQITDDYGLDNFDTQFTSEPVQLTPDDE
jgi:hypothetical protein